MITEPFLEDGREPVVKLFQAYDKLLQYGMEKDLICTQKSGKEGYEEVTFPIFGYRTTKTNDKTLWLISGVHGEEPPGPEAIAAEIDFIGEISKRIPMVVIPLCNPVGRYLGWRYQDEYRDHNKGTSVADSEHLLLDEGEQKPRTNNASNQTAKAVTEYVVRMNYKFPPLLSIDFHEDEALPQSYIYSQGERGVDDPVAKTIVKIMQDSGMTIQMSGNTRFGEPVVDGVVLAKIDGSVDELIASKRIFYEGKITDKPAATTAIVVETPTIGVSLSKRVSAHRNIIKSIETLWRLVSGMK
jgi:hypothetical protein